MNQVMGCIMVPLALYWGWGHYPWLVLPITGACMALIDAVFDHKTIDGPGSVALMFVAYPIMWTLGAAVPFLIGRGIRHLFG